jgi:hypothetical protein
VSHAVTLKNTIGISPVEAMTAVTKYTPFFRYAFALLVLTLGLTACRQSAEQAAKPAGTPVSITGYNYTIEGIQEFYVNGAWGSNLGIGDGGSRVCCVKLPEKWKPGLSATVKWQRSDCGDEKVGGKRCPFGGNSWPHKDLEATVPIEPYERPATVQVMFLPGDEIKLYVFGAGPINPAHPSKLGPPHPIGHPEWKP